MSGPNPAEFRLERPLSRAEFRAAARLGLGRAILHLRTFGSGGVKKTVEHLVLRWHGYDRQIEDSRATYLVRLAKAAGLWDRLRPLVLSRIGGASKLVDRQQAVDIAGLLRSDTEAAREIVRVAVEVGDDDAVSPLDAYIAGGVAAVDAAVVARVPRASLRGNWSYRDAYERVARRERNPTLAERWWASVKPLLNEPEPRLGSPSNPVGAETRSKIESIFTAVEAGPTRTRTLGLLNIHWYRRLGVKLSTSEIQAILDRLAVETDRHRTLRLLWVLGWKREFPRAPQVLLDLARHGTGRVRTAAIEALRSTADPRVAELGRELIRRPGAKGAVHLLEHGFAASDEALVVRDGLRRCRRGEPWLYGAFGPIIENHPEIGFAALLPELYRAVDCAHCRSSVFEQMLIRGAAPRDLLEEAAWDSCLDTRAMARRALRAL